MNREAEKEKYEELLQDIATEIILESVNSLGPAKIIHYDVAAKMAERIISKLEHIGALNET